MSCRMAAQVSAMDSGGYPCEGVNGGYDATAIATYTNRTAVPVYYQRCTGSSTGPVFDLVRDPDAGTHVVGGVFACVGGVPTGVVQPDSTLAVPISLGSLDSPDADPPIRPEDRVGRFRVLFCLYPEPAVDPDPNDRLPVEQRRSNVFDIQF